MFMTEQRPMIEWDIFPFVGDIRVKPLHPPVIPEPPRGGEPGGGPCQACERPDEHYLWVDDDWRVAVSPIPTAVAFVFLESRTHCDLADMPPALSQALGPMLQRIEAGFLATGKVGRVHINRWSDGGAHFHVWLFGRPLGALQLLGTFLPVWNGVLPPMDVGDWWRVLDVVGDSLAEGGGRRHLRRPA
jgi:diadenosine tetraphosphate (Ap4A) HIT family hydrolase